MEIERKESEDDDAITLSLFFVLELCEKTQMGIGIGIIAKVLNFFVRKVCNWIYQGLGMKMANPGLTHSSI